MTSDTNFGVQYISIPRIVHVALCVYFREGGDVAVLDYLKTAAAKGTDAVARKLPAVPANVAQ